MSCVYLVPEYNLLSRDELCSDQGMLIIRDLKDCKKAAHYLNLGSAGSIKTEMWPKGCFWDDLADWVAFNIHHTGKRNKYGKPICRTG